MKEKINVPEIGESVSSGIIAAWLKVDGEFVAEGDELFELETDKATLAVPSTVSGVLQRLAEEGEEVEVGQVVAEVDTAASAAAPPAPSAKPDPADSPLAASMTPPAGAATAAASPPSTAAAGSAASLSNLSPAVRRIVVENNLDPDSIPGTGKDGRITKADALAVLSKVLENVDALSNAQSPSTRSAPAAGVSAPSAAAGQHREKMTRLRKRIAENLVVSKQSSAHLTTFNEIDMSAVMALRSEYRDEFEKKHGVRLGFMSFFVKASAAALTEFPVANAIIDGDEIIYNDRHNIGVAVSTERGLIVPVVKDAGLKSFAEIESQILSFATRAREKKITVDELTGGTFSITNGGVFGSLLSTPIPTPPQSAILGMHSIQKRPVVVDDEIVIRPMMYVAITYDHRIMDGKDAVSFLVAIKKLVEDPRQMLLGL
jgi:2-oxoglutarate dehydrogenase E2 component (dihydrolipoamide succinyltransferase)